MPTTTVIFYQEEDGTAPVLQWLNDLQKVDKKAWAKCVVRLERLAEAGHMLRRPEADYLRDGIYELRSKQGRVQYRMLYFFHGQNIAILANSLTKEGSAVPPIEIDRALKRKAKFEGNPIRHTYKE